MSDLGDAPSDNLQRPPVQKVGSRTSGMSLGRNRASGMSVARSSMPPVYVDTGDGGPSAIGGTELASPDTVAIKKRRNRRHGRDFVEIRKFIRPEVDTEGAAFVADCFKPTKKPVLSPQARIEQTGFPLTMRKDPSQKSFVNMMTLESQKKFPKASNLAYQDESERF